MRTRHAIIAALLAAVLVGGCGSDDGTTDVATGDDDTATSTSTTEALMPDDTSSTTGGATPTGGSQFAVDDLATHLGIDADQIDVVSTEAVTWRDSSLGCPQQGFMYQQVLTEGTRIILDVDGTRYHYHSGGTGDPFRCATPQEPAAVG